MEAMEGEVNLEDNDLLIFSTNDDDKKKRTRNNSNNDKKGSHNNGGSSSMRCCQAEKCTADLSDAKQYHKRHKVCEHHAKAQVVVVTGLRQRFCQQCSRFHNLLLPLFKFHFSHYIDFTSWGSLMNPKGVAGSAWLGTTKGEGRVHHRLKITSFKIMQLATNTSRLDEKTDAKKKNDLTPIRMLALSLLSFSQYMISF